MVNEILYTRLPDGSAMDYNRIYDVIDRALATEKEKADPLRSKKRFLYQYRDAMRSRDIIQERYEQVFSAILCDEQRVIRDPTIRLTMIEDNASEISSVHGLLLQAEKECFEAKNNVAHAICALDKDEQKIVLAAHYVCGADLKWISSVYGHWTNWADEVRDRALKKMTIEEGTGDCDELDWLISQWQEDEAEFNAYIEQKPSHPPLDDRSILMGM